MWGASPPTPQVNTPLNRGPAAPGPLLNTPQTLKTIFIVMTTAAYLLTRDYIILAECILVEYRLAEYRLAEYKLAENCHTLSKLGVIPNIPSAKPAALNPINLAYAPAASSERLLCSAASENYSTQALSLAVSDTYGAIREQQRKVSSATRRVGAVGRPLKDLPGLFRNHEVAARQTEAGRVLHRTEGRLDPSSEFQESKSGA